MWYGTQQHWNNNTSPGILEYHLFRRTTPAYFSCHYRISLICGWTYVALSSSDGQYSWLLHYIYFMIASLRHYPGEGKNWMGFAITFVRIGFKSSWWLFQIPLPLQRLSVTSVWSCNTCIYIYECSFKCTQLLSITIFKLCISLNYMLCLETL